MTAKVQIKSRANRIKYFKKYIQATPSFRSYHGSRLPPRSFEGAWPHKKFFNITWGKSKKLDKGEPLLKKKLKAQPAKRKKRGILKVKRAKKGKSVVKRIEPRKKVSFSKKRSVGIRRAQKEKIYAGRKDARGRKLYGAMPLRYGADGDPLNIRMTTDERGRPVQRVVPRRRRIMIV